MAKYIYVCSQRHTFLSSEKYKQAPRCPKCSCQTKMMDIDYEDYQVLTREEKQKVKENFIATQNFLEEYEQLTNKEFISAGENAWASILTIILSIALVVCIFAGVFLLATAGMIVGLGCIIGGIIGCGSGLLICSAAQDIRHIRNQVDRFMFENKKAE